MSEADLHRQVTELVPWYVNGTLEGRSCAEIAEIMQCPVSTVKTRMFHARRRLRTLIADGAALTTRDVRVLRVGGGSGSNT